MSEIDWYKMTERPEERELHRKIRREAIMEWIGGVLLATLVVVLSWLYLVVTPLQSSAINDLGEVRGAEATIQGGEAR